MSIGRIGSGLSGGYWPYHRDSVLGPWEVNGRLWALGWSNEPSSLTSVRLFKSENGGATWQYGGPLQSQNMISGNTRIEFGVSAVLVGTILHVASGHGGGVLSLSVTAMDLSGEVSAFVSRTDAFGGNGIDNLAPDGYIPVHLAVRPDGQYLVFFQDAKMLMGNWILEERAARWNGSSWTISSTVFEVFNYPKTPRGAVLDGDDRVHMLLSTGDGGNFNAVRSTAISANNTWGSAGPAIWPFSDGTIHYPFLSGSMFKDGLLTVGGPGTQGNTLYVRHAAPAESLSWQADDVGLGFGIEHTDSNPGALVRDDEGVLHAFVVRADNRHVMHLHDQGSGNWTTPEEIIAEPVRGINANLIEGGAAIGLLYRDDLSSSSTIHFDKLVLDEGEPPPPPPPARSVSFNAGQANTAHNRTTVAPRTTSHSAGTATMAIQLRRVMARSLAYLSQGALTKVARGLKSSRTQEHSAGTGALSSQRSSRQSRATSHSAGQATLTNRFRKVARRALGFASNGALLGVTRVSRQHRSQSHTTGSASWLIRAASGVISRTLGFVAGQGLTSHQRASKAGRGAAFTSSQASFKAHRTSKLSRATSFIGSSASLALSRAARALRSLGISSNGATFTSSRSGRFKRATTHSAGSATLIARWSSAVRRTVAFIARAATATNERSSRYARGTGHSAGSGVVELSRTARRLRTLAHSAGRGASALRRVHRAFKSLAYSAGPARVLFGQGPTREPFPYGDITFRPGAPQRRWTDPISARPRILVRFGAPGQRSVLIQEPVMMHSISEPKVKPDLSVSSPTLRHTVNEPRLRALVVGEPRIDR